jgi:hypothetical protein
MVNFSSFLQGGLNDEAVRFAVPLHVFWSNHDYIHSMTYAMKIHVDIPCETASVIFPSLHNQQIHVAIRSHLPTCCRTKKNDLLRFGDFHDPPYDFLKDLLTQDILFSFHYSVTFVPQKLAVSSTHLQYTAKAAHQPKRLDMTPQSNEVNSISRSSSHLPVGFKEILNIHLVFLVWI